MLLKENNQLPCFIEYICNLSVLAIISSPFTVLLFVLSLAVMRAKTEKANKS